MVGSVIEWWLILEVKQQETRTQGMDNISA